MEIDIRSSPAKQFPRNDSHHKRGFRACLHEGRGPRVGEVTRPAMVEKQLAFTCNLTHPATLG